MKADELFRLLKMRVTAKQRAACRYLESIGERICVEFGIDNCIERAREHWRNRKRCSR